MLSRMVYRKSNSDLIRNWVSGYPCKDQEKILEIFVISKIWKRHSIELKKLLLGPWFEICVISPWTDINQWSFFGTPFTHPAWKTWASAADCLFLSQSPPWSAADGDGWSAIQQECSANVLHRSYHNCAHSLVNSRRHNDTEGRGQQDHLACGTVVINWWCLAVEARNCQHRHLPQCRIVTRLSFVQYMGSLIQ